MADHEDILARWRSMLGRRRPWENHWQDILDYVDPSVTPINGEGQRGEKRGEKRFDSTATRFMRRMTSTLASLIANPSENWVGLVAERLEGHRYVQVEEKQLVTWLEDSMEQLLGAYQSSNFYGELDANLEANVNIGTTVFNWDEKRIKGEGFGGFSFRNLAVGECCIDEDDYGEVDTYFRTMKLTARQAKMRFKNDTLHESIDEAIRDKQSDKEFEFIHAVYRRDDPVYGEERRVGDNSMAGADWVSCYVDKTNRQKVSEGGYRDQRYFASRWHRSSGELYGRSPSMDALADIKSLNTIVRYGLEGLILQVYPPWLIPDESLLGRLKLTPGARNSYDPSSQGEIKSLTAQGNFGVEQAKEAELRQAIAAAYLDDILGLREEGDLTATEILDRRERRQQVTGSPVTRYMTSSLGPLVESTWMYMFRIGAFGRPPESIGDAARLRVEFLSVLTRQQRMAAMRSLQDTFALLLPLAEARPAMLDNYDFDAIARDVPEDMGVRQKWLVDEEARDQGRRARAAAQQQQMAMEQGQELAKTAAELVPEQ